MPFESTTAFSIGPHHNAGESLNIPPVIPFRLNAEWDLIAEPSLSVTYVPSPHEQFGLQDLQTSLFLTPHNANVIIQNTNAYEVGFTAAWEGFRNALWKHRTPETEQPLMAFLELDAIKSVYLHGHKQPDLISPDNWNMDYRFMERPNARKVQEFFYDYRTNVTLYPQWQAFLRNRQPKTIIFWGQDDIFFTREGGDAYLNDMPNAEMHRLDSGHFAVEDCLEYIVRNIRRFYDETVATR